MILNYYHMLSFRYADQVSVGDEVIILQNDKIIPAKVIHVSNLVLQGINFAIIPSLIYQLHLMNIFWQK